MCQAWAGCQEYKTNEVLIQDTTQTNLNKIMLSERRQTRDHMLYDSIYMKSPEKANLQKQKADQQLPGAGNGSEE